MTLLEHDIQQDLERRFAQSRIRREKQIKNMTTPSKP